MTADSIYPILMFAVSGLGHAAFYLFGRLRGYEEARKQRDAAMASWKSLDAEHFEALHLLLGLLTLLREHPEILINHPTLTKRLTDWMSEPPVN